MQRHNTPSNQIRTEDIPNTYLKVSEIKYNIQKIEKISFCSRGQWRRWRNSRATSSETVWSLTNMPQRLQWRIRAGRLRLWADKSHAHWRWRFANVTASNQKQVWHCALFHPLYDQTIGGLNENISVFRTKFPRLTISPPSLEDKSRDWQKSKHQSYQERVIKSYSQLALTSKGVQ